MKAGTYKFALARLNDDGSLDNNFDGDGRVIEELSAESGSFNLTILSDGRILAVGYSFNGADYDMCFVMFNPDGSFDTSFGTNGVANVDFGGGWGRRC